MVQVIKWDLRKWRVYPTYVSSQSFTDRAFSGLPDPVGERLAHGRKRVLHHGDEIELGATSKHSGIGATHGGVKLVYHKTELRTDEVRVRTRLASHCLPLSALHGTFADAAYHSFSVPCSISVSSLCILLRSAAF